jgi:hypothetical protein
MPRTTYTPDLGQSIAQSVAQRVRLVKSCPEPLAKQRRTVGPDFDHAWQWVDGVVKGRRQDVVREAVAAGYRHHDKAKKAVARADAWLRQREQERIIAQHIEAARLAKVRAGQIMAATKLDAERAHESQVAKAASLAARIEVVETNWARATDQIERDRARKADWHAAYAEPERGEWSQLALDTQDADLKRAYAHLALGAEDE